MPDTDEAKGAGSGPKLTGPQGSQGYYAVLGVEFGTPTEQIQKKYKRAAILYHPDKVGDDREKIDMFQQLTTAYQVLSKPDAVRAYWEMYRMRCYLFQGPHEPGQPLAPFYLLHVKKADKLGVHQERLLTLDVLAGEMTNWKKDQPHRKTSLAEIKAVRPIGSLPETCTSFSLEFADAARNYKLQCESPGQCAAYVSILSAIVDGGSPPQKTDAFFPPRSARKGFVEKKGKGGGDWARRWLLLGAGQLLIFRSMACDALVNAVPLRGHHAACSVALGADGAWSIKTPDRTWTFRNSKLSIAKEWVKAVQTVLDTMSETTDWLPGGKAQGSLVSSKVIDAASAAAESARGDDIDEELGPPGTKQLLLDASVEAKAEGIAASRAATAPAKPPSLADLRGGANGGGSAGDASARQSTAGGRASMVSGKLKRWSVTAGNMFGGGGGRRSLFVPADASAADPSKFTEELAESRGRALAEHLGKGMVRHHL